jgi:hypothetical protein
VWRFDEKFNNAGLSTSANLSPSISIKDPAKRK